MLMPFSGNWGGHVNLMKIFFSEGGFSSREGVCGNIRVRCNRRQSQEERLLGLHSFVEEAQPFFSQDICRVMAFPTDRRISISLEGCIQIVVRMWI